MPRWVFPAVTALALVTSVSAHAATIQITMENLVISPAEATAKVGDTIELDNFSNIQSVTDVLQHLSTDTHGNAVVDLGNHDSITFQGINAATIQANALHMFVLHSTGGNIA